MDIIYVNISHVLKPVQGWKMPIKYDRCEDGNCPNDSMGIKMATSLSVVWEVSNAGEPGRWVTCRRNPVAVKMEIAHEVRWA